MIKAHSNKNGLTSNEIFCWVTKSRGSRHHGVVQRKEEKIRNAKKCRTKALVKKMTNQVMDDLKIVKDPSQGQSETKADRKHMWPLWNNSTRKAWSLTWMFVKLLKQNLRYTAMKATLKFKILRGKNDRNAWNTTRCTYSYLVRKNLRRDAEPFKPLGDLLLKPLSRGSTLTSL